MAKSINKVQLIGRLGNDPELRYTGSGEAVCNFNMATDESYKDSDGNKVEKTEWHRIVAWSRLAEICGEYIKKGSLVFVAGKIQTRSYENKEGVTVYMTEIKINEMLMLEGKGGGNPASKSEPKQDASKGDYSGASQEGFTPDDDLPF